MKNFLKTILERLKSPIVWSGIAVQVANIITIYNPTVADHFKIIIVALGEIYTLFAMVNNPSDKDNF